MTAGFDELVFVQTGTFFPPAFALGHRLYTIENLFSDPRLRTVPLNDFLPVLYIDGARTAIQPETSPIPKLESEDIRSRTDFKHHTVCSGTMYRAGRYQQMVVLLNGIAAHIFLRIEATAFLCFIKGINHLFRFDPLFHPQIHGSIFCRIQHIIAFVLRVVHTELFLYILCQRMYLQTQISSLHRIEKVETDRKLVTETAIYRIA